MCTCWREDNIRFKRRSFGRESHLCFETLGRPLPEGCGTATNVPPAGLVVPAQADEEAQDPQADRHTGQNERDLELRLGLHAQGVGVFDQ